MKSKVEAHTSDAGLQSKNDTSIFMECSAAKLRCNPLKSISEIVSEVFYTYVKVEKGRQWP